MSKVYKNTYTPPKVEINDYHPDTTEDEYDHNFVFEVKALRSDRVELRPFIVSYPDHRLYPRAIQSALLGSGLADTSLHFIRSCYCKVTWMVPK